MTTGKDWPVDVVPVGSVAMGSSLWRARGKLNAAVFVKGTYSLVPGGVMAPADPLPIERSERYPQNNPIASLEAVCESLPVLPEVDVLVYGHAHAPPGEHGVERAAQSMARLSLLRDEQPLIDKTILVYGQRVRGSAPEPFERLPIGYDRALGGIGFADNPIGVGADSAQAGLPNFVDVHAPEQRVACFGPIPPSFPKRRRLLGSFGRHQLDEPVVEIPDDLDWRYFQSAPEDQRIGQLRGDETLVLEGLTAGLPVLRTALPGAQALMRIYPAAGGEGSEPLAMRPDLVQINTNRMQCTIVWRSSVPLGTAQQAATVVVAGAVELPGQPVVWPASAQALCAGRASRAASPSQVPPTGPLSDRTVLIDEGGSEPPAAAPSTPDLEGTYVLTEHQAAAAAAAVSAPFALPTPNQPGGASPGDGLLKTFPGAPWGKRKPSPTPVPIGGQDVETVSVDLVLSDDDVDVPPPAAPAMGLAAAAEDPPGGHRARAEAARAVDLAAEEQAALEAERQAQVEQERARREAAERAEAARQVEAERFAAEQQAAREAEARRRDDELAKRTNTAKQLKTNLYGGFRKS